MRRVRNLDDFDLGEIRHRLQVVEAKAQVRGWLTERDVRDAAEGTTERQKDEDGNGRRR